MKIISFCNKKGGVGKTTLATNTAYKLAEDGKKILLIDLDPQANLTTDFFEAHDKVEFSIIDIVSSKNNLKLMSLDKIIKNSKYANIDIIPANKELNKSSLMIGINYDQSEIYKLADSVYNINENIFSKYNYVIIDYPPTINELSLNFLVSSDCIIIPTNEALRSFKGILDLKDNILHICKLEKREVPEIKIVFNNVKNSASLAMIKKWLIEQELDKYSTELEIKTSDVFKTVENTLNSIWSNSSYWRQKQVYEQLVNEIK